MQEDCRYIEMSLLLSYLSLRKYKEDSLLKAKSSVHLSSSTSTLDITLLYE